MQELYVEMAYLLCHFSFCQKYILLHSWSLLSAFALPCKDIFLSN